MTKQLRIITLISLLITTLTSLSAQQLKPYILGSKTSESITATKDILAAQLAANDIEVVGQYQPADDANRWVMVFTSPELKEAVKQVGGLTGFAATLRIGITVENGETLISYTNPSYWGNAYFRADYPKVSAKYQSLEKKLIKAMKASGNYVGTQFGSEDGLSASELRKYHYMMGMPYFDDTEELEVFTDHQSALNKIQASMFKGLTDLKLIYSVTIPGQDLVLYGFAIEGTDGESKFLPIVDIGSPKHTAFLPYEVLVKGEEVHMLHGRYRIALSFPDLTMGTFSKIMSTPGEIEEALEQLVE